MNQRHDLLAISLLFLSAAFIAAMTAGISLKDWQPLMAAFVALAGGALAYKAAMAKVDYDRATRDRDERRKKLGIYLRAEHTCNNLLDRAASLGDRTSIARRNARIVHLDELKILTDAPDLAEIWGNLELFPPGAAFRLSQVQSCIRTLTNFVASQPADTSWEIGDGHQYTTHMKVTHDVARDLHLACRDVLSEIQPIILVMSTNQHSE